MNELARALILGGLKKENFSFYFPLATCVLISFVLSLIMFLFGRK